MGLPWIQVASEVIEHGAADLALMLDTTEEAAGWGQVRLFDWALKRCPKHLPPSWADTVKGPLAAKMVARAFGWKGDPDALIAACMALPEPPLHRMPNGDIRICGLKRYDAAWKKNNRELWEKLQTMVDGPAANDAPAKLPPSSPLTPPVDMPEQSRAEPGGKPAGKTPEPEREPAAFRPLDRDRDRDTKKEKASAPAVAAPRIKALTERLVEDYREKVGGKYLHGGAKDTEALKRIISTGASNFEIRARFRAGLATKNAKNWLYIRTIAQLGMKWNDLEGYGDPPPQELEPPPELNFAPLEASNLDTEVMF